MSDTVIKVENLSKEYRLGIINHGVLFRDLQSWWAKLRGKEDPNSLVHLHGYPQTGPKSDRFLALDNVSFEIKQGDVVGIIGRNGAGKSTLLKILSKVTSPTSGEVKIKGRVASLLEVGTGFHPELTGRENIFLNGAILGMSKAEIRRKLDEIIAFAEIEKFIDTPVKRYSSGMYVRLAFAVAAHLEPEILIVDEVLAVGDAAFQKKCLGKMQEVGKEGRTVLFVSHNVAAIKKLCDRAILLGAGKLLYDGNVNTAIDHYLNKNKTGPAHNKIIPFTYPRSGSGAAQLRKIELLTQKMKSVPEFYFGQPFRILFTIEVRRHISDEILAYVYITDADGTRFAVTYNAENGCSGWILNEGLYQVSLDISTVLLPHKTYSLDIGLYNRLGTEVYDFVEQVLQFNVSPASETKVDNYPGSQSHAFVRIDSNWSQPFLVTPSSIL